MLDPRDLKKEGANKPLLYVKFFDESPKGIQDKVNAFFIENSVTAGMQIPYFDEGFQREDEWNIASHYVSLLFDPNM